MRAKSVISTAMLLSWCVCFYQACSHQVRADDSAVRRDVAEFYSLLARGRSPQLEHHMSKGLLDLIQGLGAQKERAFKTIQEQAPPNVHVVQEIETSENSMTLHVMGTWTEPTPAEAHGTVYLVNELGGWKIDRHQWEPRKRTTPQIPAAAITQSSTSGISPTSASAAAQGDATRMHFPSQPLQGKVKGEPFVVDCASFSGETLAFEHGKNNKVEVVLPHGTLVPGRSISVSAHQTSARHKVVIYKNGERTSSLKTAGSSLRVQLGELKNNQLSGYIIVKYPEQQTELSGYFYANKKSGASKN